MKLTHKNFLYTAIVTSILTILVLGYFVFMLPSLYVDYMSNENYNSIVEQHTGYLKDGSYENVTTNNINSITIDIPFSEEFITVTGKSFQMKITPTTEDMNRLFSEIKTYVKSNIGSDLESTSIEKESFIVELNEKAIEWKDDFMKQTTFLEDLPFEIEAESDLSNFDYYENESTAIHFISDDTIVIEAGVEDGENHYTNYIGLTYNSNRIVISLLSSMTPQMNEILPIVIRSLPMLIAVMILFALVVSSLYSKGIVDPIIRLVKHTETVKRSGDLSNATLPTKGNDEIVVLIQTLNELYEELDHNYKEMELKNKELKEKNIRQEVFLRSSSHQLKTPISAALLLVDGMNNQIGKYQNTKVYLPEVKKKLLSMQKMVEDILYLSRCEKNITYETVNLNELIEGQLSFHQIELADGDYKLVKNYSQKIDIITDSNLVLNIIDNLITNAIVHSKKGARITITTKPNQFCIHNCDAHIEKELMPNIFEPFVSGNTLGHGLGLYIVAYYVNILDAKIEISNVEDGVLTTVTFDTNHDLQST